MSARPYVIAAGGANFGSLLEACRRIGVDADVGDDPARIRAATHVILPGVGAAAHAMQALRERGVDRVLREITQPLLGICLGMQLLFESSDESLQSPELALQTDANPDLPAPAICGSGFSRDALKPFTSSGGSGGEAMQRASESIGAEAPPTGTRLPRFPNSEIHCLGLLAGRVLRLPAAPSWPHMGWNQTEAVSAHPLFDGIAANEWFYFVHGYAAPVNAQTIARSEHGHPFAAAVARGNIHGVQFHPEKSAAAGRRLLANFFALT